jgi:hypothetical protein
VGKYTTEDTDHLGRTIKKEIKDDWRIDNVFYDFLKSIKSYHENSEETKAFFDREEKIIKEIQEREKRLREEKKQRIREWYK